jgi:hypothetical protein
MQHRKANGPFEPKRDAYPTEVDYYEAKIKFSQRQSDAFRLHIYNWKHMGTCIFSVKEVLDLRTFLKEHLQ